MEGFGEPFENLLVSRVVAGQLGVWAGPQERIVAAYVFQDFRDRAWTTVVVVKRVLGHINFRVVVDHMGNLLYVKVNSAEDVDKLHGHCWQWWNERVVFKRVNRFTLYEIDPEGFGDINQIY